MLAFDACSACVEADIATVAGNLTAYMLPGSPNTLKVKNLCCLWRSMFVFSRVRSAVQIVTFPAVRNSILCKQTLVRGYGLASAPAYR
jgi:hypothetical protein